MAQTPNSSSSPYLTSAELIARFDTNLIMDLCSDTGIPIDVVDLPNNVALNAALVDASGILESAAFVGRRYSADDLAALVATNVDGSPKYMGSGLIKRIVGALAIGLLKDRRGMRTDDFPPYRDALSMLESLRRGLTIFGFFESADAGLPEQTQLTINDFLRRGRISTMYRPFFGIRADERNGFNTFQ